jgi:alkylation response protein AidB-like acyl-CoA dehydrogenase
VDFSLSEEQVLLRESVVKYIVDHGTVERHRALLSGDPGFDTAAWQTFAELGWLALPFSEDDGGLGGCATDLMVFCESLGRGLVREPFLHTAVCCGGLLAAAGNGAQRARYLPPIIAGDAHWGFAFAEASSAYDMTAISSTAMPQEEGVRLSGEKIAVLNGHVAQHLLVTALTVPGDPQSLGLFIVDADSPGVHRERFTALDGSHGAMIRFDNVVLPAESALGVAGEVLATVYQVLDRVIVALGADALGAMQVLLDATVEYCKTREQFGQPIGKFQALQHRMAEMYLKQEEMRSLLFNAAIQLDEGSADAAAACAALKVKLAEAGRFISHESVQLHGGIGMTDELIVGHLFKRLLLLSKLFGDEDYYLRRYMELQAA